MKTERHHIIVQVSSDIHGLEDVERLNLKSQVREVLRNTLRDLMQKIASERSAASEFLAQYQAFHIHQIQCAYENLRNYSNYVYDLYVKMCWEIDGELGNLESELSKETELFIDFAAHISADKVPFFLKIDEFLGQNIKLTIKEMPEMPTFPLGALLKSWGKVAKCECEECENYRYLFGLPLQMSWLCYNCRTENKGSNECFACHSGRNWADYLTCQDVKLSEDRKKWICPKCSFKNGLHEGVCCKCKASCAAIQQGLSSLPLFLKKLSRFFI